MKDTFYSHIVFYFRFLGTIFASFCYTCKKSQNFCYTRFCYTMGISKLLVIPVLLILPKFCYTYLCYIQGITKTWTENFFVQLQGVILVFDVPDTKCTVTLTSHTKIFWIIYHEWNIFINIPVCYTWNFLKIFVIPFLVILRKTFVIPIFVIP